MKIALLGLAQSGKRTLFSLLTGRHVSDARKEDESIEGMAAVRDPRVDDMAAIVKPEKIKYAETAFALCPDMEIGTGAGKRKWLEEARRSDLLCMVVRSFTSESVYHPCGSVDTRRDRLNLESELLLADLELVETRLDRIVREKKAGQTPAQVLEEKALVKCKETIEAEKWLKEIGLNEQEERIVRSLGLLTLKPVMWTYNVDEKDVKDSGTDPFTVACSIEKEIADISDETERREYLKDLGLTSSGADRMNRAAYDALGLMAFYTIGSDEVRAWTIQKGTTALVAAGKIHSDIARGFIRVEIFGYDDLMAAGSESAVKEHGKTQVKGKDYIIQDGDICHFRFNV